MKYPPACLLCRRQWLEGATRLSLLAVWLILFTLSLFVTPIWAQSLDMKKQLEERIQRIETANGEGEPDNQGLLQLYRNASDLLSQASEYEKKAADFKQALEDAPKEISQHQKDLKKLTREIDDRPPVDFTSVDEMALNDLIDKESGNITKITTQLNDITSQINTLNTRPDIIRDAITFTKSRLEEVDIELRKRPPAESISALSEAQMAADQAKRQLLVAEINMLDAERLSHAVRLEALQLHQGLLEKQLALSEQNLEAVRDEINRRGTQAAEEAEVQVSRAVQAAEGQHALIAQVAEENSEFSLRFSEISKVNEATTTELGQSQLLYRQIDQNYQQATLQLEITRLDKTLGQFLRSQRVKLPSPAKFEKRRKRYSLLLDEYRLGQLRLRAEQTELLDLKLAVEQRIEASRNLLEDLPESEVMSISSQLKTLLTDRKALLDSLEAAYVHGIKLLGDIILEQQNLSERVTKYGLLLDENLLWVANSEAIDVSWFSSFAAPFTVLVSPSNWANSLLILMRQALDHYLWSLVILGLCLTLLVKKRAMRRYLEHVAGAVGKVRRDRFTFTLNALVISILLAIPWAILIAYAGWLLKSHADPFPRAVGFGLSSAAEVFVVLMFFRVLYIPDGLAKAHFHWQARVRQNVSRNLTGFIPLAVTLSFLIGMTESAANGLYRDTLGRLTFIIGMLALMTFSWRIFNIRGRKQAGQVMDNRGFWVWQTRYIWYPLLLLTPLVFMAMAAYGYHYTALQLARFLFYSVSVTLVTRLLYALAVRWLLVAQRRLAMERALQKRQAELEARASREATDQAGEISVENIDIPELDLTTIDEQTRRLIGLALTGFAIVCLWFIWRDILPALGILDEITIWEHSVPGESGERLIPISLADLGAAGLVLMLTLMAESNLPGLLEIALLEPLNVERGNRYAVSSLIRYLILIVGILAAFSLIGIGWNQVQWLVAAVGVGLGFGLKEIFANLISGIIVLFERPVRIGDTVTIGDISGIVSRIRMRATTITDFDNKELIIPNQTLIVESLVNWTLTEPITRLKFGVGIAYGSDTEKALQLITEAVTSNPQVLDEPTPTVFFVGFGDSSLDFEVRAFVRERSMRLPLLHDLHMALEKSLRENGIEIPFPQRDLHLRSADAALQVVQTDPGGDS